LVKIIRLGLSLCLVWSLLACKKPKHTDFGKQNEVPQEQKLEGTEVKLISSAGDLFEGNHHLPLPLNHAFICGATDSLDILILSKVIPQATAIIKPLAYFEVHQQDEKRRFVLTTPSDTSFAAIPLLTFDDLMLKHYSIKVIIDLWFSNYKGTSKTKTTNWKNNYYAEIVLKQYKGCTE
jgi:inorganic pyrophosphatase